MRVLTAALAAGAALIGPASAATFQWINGKVTSFTAQLPSYTVAIVDNKPVRFCDPQAGVDYVVMTNNVQYDLLKSALETNRNVQVGVQNFGADARSGSPKLCIDRVIY